MQPSKPFRMARGGLRQPGKVLPFLRLWAEELVYRPGAGKGPGQRERIAELVGREGYAELPPANSTGS